MVKGWGFSGSRWQQVAPVGQWGAGGTMVAPCLRHCHWFLQRNPPTSPHCTARWDRILATESSPQDTCQWRVATYPHLTISQLSPSRGTGPIIKSCHSLKWMSSNTNGSWYPTALHWTGRWELPAGRSPFIFSSHSWVQLAGLWPFEAPFAATTIRMICHNRVPELSPSPVYP